MKHIIARFFAALQSGDVALAVEQFTPDVLYQEPEREPISGRQALAVYFTDFVASGVSWDCMIVEVLETTSARLVLLYQYTSGGTHQARIERDGCALVQFEGDRIAQWREYRG